jgi:bacillithiol system protein YtxJ
MDWIELTTEDQLTALTEKSFQASQVVFKHSTRCSISSVVLRRLEKENPAIDFYYLDLIRHRSLSDKIAVQFQVHHESPQVLLIKNGECIYAESHMAIQMDDILEQAAL